MQTIEAIVSPLKIFKRLEKLMGNRFELTVVCADEKLAHVSLEKAIAEISRIEKLLTTFSTRGSFAIRLKIRFEFLNFS